MPAPPYQNLLGTLEQEFTYTFGGCTIFRGLYRSYLSRSGSPIADGINVLQTDTSIRFDANLTVLSRFMDKLRQATFDALEEEAVLIVALKVCHSA